MNKKFILLFSIFAVSLVFSTVYVIGGTQAYTQYQQAHIAQQRYCGGQGSVHICVDTPEAIYSAFYPSYLAQHYPVFAVEYSSTQPMTLFISVTITGFSQMQTQSVQASYFTQKAGFTPPMQGQALQNLTGEDTTTLHVVVTDSAAHTYYLNDLPLLLHSRWLMLWTKSNLTRIAAWVTPNDTRIASLVASASNYLNNQKAPAPTALIGYNHAGQQQVIDQVDAIYDALLAQKMRYVQATIPFTGDNSNTNASEEIKLPGEVLQQHSGMCIELTLLLASAVERIGLNPEIILIPGHAFLGVATTPDDKHFAYWDAVALNNGVAGDSANLMADKLYAQNLAQHTIIATISVKDALHDGIGPMLGSVH
jgi:hypothetical protein